MSTKTVQYKKLQKQLHSLMVELSDPNKQKQASLVGNKIANAIEKILNSNKPKRPPPRSPDALRTNKPKISLQNIQGVQLRKTNGPKQRNIKPLPGRPTPNNISKGLSSLKPIAKNTVSSRNKKINKLQSLISTYGNKIRQGELSTYNIKEIKNKSIKDARLNVLYKKFHDTNGKPRGLQILKTKKK